MSSNTSIDPSQLEGIAIVGMSGRFPGARSVQEFWDNLTAGRETISVFSEEELEFSVASPEAKAQGQKFVAARGILEGVDQFDAAFFGIYPKEAEIMDPQHRLFLECSWEAIEGAGYDPESYPGMIGVYGGLSLNTYLLSNLCRDREFAANFSGNYQVGAYQVMLGNDKDFLPTRVSYKLNLRGPSMSIQTACSTSLVAISQACTSLLTYQCDMALAGGSSISFPQKRNYLYQEEGMVSGDGTCRTFDASAHGTVFGHGVAVVLLKRLADAVADGDQVLAVIKGTAINNDGSAKIGYAAPSINAQADVIALAQAAAGVDPESISYIEAHGTGTPLGDPIEITALTKAFREGGSTKVGFCAIGTGKTHIGHLDVAAGATGLIKTVLQLQHELIPPLLHFKAPNPKIDFANSPFYPVTRPLEWKRGPQPRRAGVSAFGVGGTNAHVIVEEAPLRTPGGPSRRQQLLVLSAKTETALRAMSERLAAFLEASPSVPLPEVAFTLQQGRKGFTYRRSVVVSNHQEASAHLRQPDAKTDHQSKASSAEPSVVFLFPGQGAQYVDMGRELYETESAFRAAIDQCASILQNRLGLDIRRVLYPSPDQRPAAETEINKTWITQPSIFVVEYALAQLWLSWGIKPSILIGHSIGEYVAAVLAETFTLEAALDLLASRAKLMQGLPAGSMLAVRLSGEETAPLLPRDASIAAFNSPKLCTVAGPTPTLEEFQKTLEAKKIASRFLPTSHAFHSSMMDPMLAEFTALAAKTPHQAPQLPWISTCTGRALSPSDLQDGTYWAKQLRQSVRFVEALETVIRDEKNIILEIGPGQTLSQLARQHPAKPSGLVIAGSLGPTDAPGRDLSSMLSALGRLWVSGVRVGWSDFSRGESRRRVALPTYPFERQRFWVAAVNPAASVDAAPAPAPTTTVPLPLATPMPATSPTMAIPPASVSAPPAVMSVPAVPPAEPRRNRIAVQLREIVKELSGVDVTNDSASFMELGFDSLFLTQASQAFQQKFHLKLTFRQMLGDLSSVEALANYIDNKLPADALPAPAPASAPATPAPIASAASAATPPPAAVNVTSSPLNTTSIAASPAGGSMMEQLMAQQIQLMQLLLAQQKGEVAPAPAAIPAGTSASGGSASSLPTVRWPGAKPPAHAVATAQQEFKRFGPYKPIEKGQKGGLTAVQERALNHLLARYQAKTGRSKNYTAEHRPHFADPRAVAGFKRNWKEMVYPIVSTRSKGSRIWDLDGNEYVDITMGFGTYFFGHSPDWLIQPLHEQLDTGIEIGPQSALAGEVAKMICEFTGMDRATFCNTGSEAVMAAIRLARTITGRKRVVYFTGDYHGMFEEVLVRGAWVNGEYRAQAIAPGIPSSLVENMLILEYGVPESLEVIKAHIHEIAAVLVEPVQSRSPGLQPKEFMKALRQITRDAEAALIFDEVVTGFRCHPGGAQAYFGVEADMATYGKVIGGGIPIGVLAGKRQYMDALDGGAWNYGDDSFPEVGVTFFAGTFVRHPLAIRAAWTILKRLQQEGPQLQAGITDRVTKFCSELNQYFERNQVPIRFPHFCAFANIEHAHDLEYISLLWYFMRLKGVHVWEGRPCYFTLAHTEADLSYVSRAFKEAVAEMQLGGFLPGTSDAEFAQIAGTQAALPPGAPTPPPSGATPTTVSARTRPDTQEIPGLPPGTRSCSLTDSQKEMWLSTQIQPEASGAFNASNVVQLRGPLNIECLRRAIHQVIDRHEALRSTFSADGMCILIHPSITIDVPVHDFSDLPQVERESETAQILQQEGQRLYDLTEGPLVTFHIIKLSQSEHMLVFSLNMIVCDGWGYNVVLEEISELYSAYVEDRAPSLRPIVPMRHYAEWLGRPEQQEIAAQSEAFWLARFPDVPAPLDLPSYRPRPKNRSYEGERHSLRLPASLFQSIKKTAQSQRNTPFALLLGAYQVWLHRLSGLNDIVIGVPYAGQSAMGSETLVGQCVHTLPLRAAINPAEPFNTLLKNALGLVLDTQENWNTTFGTIAQKLDIPRDPSRIPLASVLFNLDPPLNKVRFSGLSQKITAGPRFFFQYDLGFNLVDEGDHLLVECDYNRNMFDAESIRRWVGHFQTLLESIVADPATPIGQLSLLNQAERHQILVEWNQTTLELPEQGSVVELCTAQARQTPKRVAVEFEGQRLSYAELDARSNQVAHHLAKAGAAPNSVVAVCLERSLDMVIGLLGILKAGAAYVPIDPEVPTARITSMLSDSGAKIVLSQQSLQARLGSTKIRVISMDGQRDALLAESQGPVSRPIHPDDLAYAIYTSGSTGTPKAAEITHRAFANFLISMRRQPGITSEDVVLALTTLSFDIAGLEVFLPLISGAKIVIAPRTAALDPAILSDLISRTGITLAQATPTTWRMLAASNWRGGPKLKLLCGGEPMAADLAEKLLGRCGSLWNVYGPTETTIWSTAVQLKKAQPISIGRPIANTQTYIVDSQLQPVPIGVAGELLIGGLGLARGYRNRSALTEEKFIPNPFSSASSPRVYRTGDLARFLPTGEIECLGRIDFQVKLRGHRIELGEIETVLLTSPKLKEAAVILTDESPGHPALVAYIVPKGGPGSLDETSARSEFKALLRASLPEYMVPCHFVVLPKLPQTSNGKIDRRALPHPGPSQDHAADDFVPPRNATEKKLAQIWSEILKLEQISIRSNFFDLGGQSLRAVALFARIEKEFGKKLPLATLFKSPTIEQLSRALTGEVEESADENWSPLVPIQPRGNKRPLFLVHGAGGNVLLYQALARHLAPDYPLYGLQSQGLDAKTPPLNSLEEMAALYLKEVRKIQPKGPYLLGGYCMGGTIAYEMAQMLLKAGETTRLLAMLDTYNFGLALKTNSTSHLLQKMKFHVGNFVKLSPGEMVKYIKEKARVARDGELANLLSRKGPAEPASPGSDEPTQLREASVQASNDAACDRYEPKPYAGTLTLFKPKVNYDYYPDPKMGWGDLAKGGIDPIELPVNPHAMLVEPYVQLLATELKSRIDKLG
jgi:amino acid adenylation domain-containing protein